MGGWGLELLQKAAIFKKVYKLLKNTDDSNI